MLEHMLIPLLNFFFAPTAREYTTVPPADSEARPRVAAVYIARHILTPAQVMAEPRPPRQVKHQGSCCYQRKDRRPPCEDRQHERRAWGALGRVSPLEIPRNLRHHQAGVGQSHPSAQ